MQGRWIGDSELWGDAVFLFVRLKALTVMTVTLSRTTKKQRWSKSFHHRMLNFPLCTEIFKTLEPTFWHWLLSKSRPGHPPTHQQSFPSSSPGLAGALWRDSGGGSPGRRLREWLWSQRAGAGAARPGSEPGAAEGQTALSGRKVPVTCWQPQQDRQRQEEPPAGPADEQETSGQLLRSQDGPHWKFGRAGMQ